MFDIGWTELLLIGVVALIVIGPKDLPDMFRQLGRFTAKLRSMAREFQRAMDQAAKETGAADLAKDVKAMANPKSMGVDAVRSAADKFEKWDPLKNTIKPTGTPTIKTPLTPPAMPAMASTVPTPAPAPMAPTAPAVGPATQALYEKQAAKQAVLKEAAARLQSIESGEAVTKAKAPRAKSAAKPPAAKENAATPAPAKAPRATAAKASAAPAAADPASPPKPARKPARKPAPSEPK